VIIDPTVRTYTTRRLLSSVSQVNVDFLNLDASQKEMFTQKLTVNLFNQTREDSQNVLPPLMSLVIETPNNSQPPDSPVSNLVLVLSSVGGGVFILAIVTVAIICSIIKQRRKRRRKSVSSSEKDNLLPPAAVIAQSDTAGSKSDLDDTSHLRIDNFYTNTRWGRGIYNQ
jgi:hypothetical protein